MRPVERVREVTVDGRKFWLSFNDFALGVSLGAKNPEAAAVIPDIRARLMALR